MSYNNGRIESPVSIYDIQRALSLGSSDLGTLIKDGLINMWARYKPQRRVGMKKLTYQERSQYHSADRSKFGIQIPFCTLDVMNYMVYDLLTNASSTYGWKYLRPLGDRTAQGEGKQFYRESDFGRLLNDATDPFYNTPYNKGYNHRANIPFEAFLNMTGVTERYSLAAGGTYYEINIQVANTLTITFFNSIGDDLHLQDLIDMTAEYSSNIKWRPVLQVFNDYTPAGGEPWYQRSQPDREVAGDAITNVQGGTWSVSLPLNSYTPDANKFYHLCIGVGCCNQASPIVWKDNNESLFILPYTDEQYENNEFPFYYRFSVVSYQSRRLNVTQIQFFQGGLQTWAVATKSGSVFTINSLSTDVLRLTLTITKLPSQSLEFIGQYGTLESEDNSPLKVQARETINYVETIKYLVPQTSSWQNPSYNPVIAAGNESETVTIYATLNIGEINVGDYAEYHLYAFTGAFENDQEKYDNIGSFSIQKIQYQ